MAGLTPDREREESGFSDDLEVLHRRLLAAGTNGMERLIAEWLQRGQPCLFARMAAAMDRIDVAVLDERVLSDGDEALARALRPHRSRWLRRAYRGESFGLLLIVAGPELVGASADAALMRTAVRLAGAYAGRPVEPDQLVLEDIYLDLGENAARWRAPLNLFAGQADGRWWHDRRIPCGLALSINSVGHMMRVLGREQNWSDAQAGRFATRLGVRTIAACAGRAGRAYVRLLDRAASDYAAMFQTDWAVPSAVFGTDAPAAFDHLFSLTADFGCPEGSGPEQGWSEPESRSCGGGVIVATDEALAHLDALERCRSG